MKLIDRRSYSIPLSKSSQKCTSKVRGLSSSQTDDEDQQGHQNPQFHKCRQGRYEPGDDVYLPSQDD